MTTSYPIQFDVDLPTRPLDRLTTAFRIVVAIPILVLLGFLTQNTLEGQGNHDMTFTFASGASLLFIPLLLMILFRQKYPRWWFDWNLNVLRSMTVTRRPTSSSPSTLTSPIQMPAS